MKVIKRNGAEVEFDIVKIIAAVTKANAATEEDARMTPVQIQRIAESVVLSCETLGRSPVVEEVQDMVEHQIMAHGAFEVAKSYITYRYTRTLVRQSNTTDDKILSLIECNNEEVKQENANKNPTVNSVQRDYMAGEVSKDIARRILLPREIVEAHEQGIIHFHDMDYFAQHMHNCDLVNLEDMLQNGTVITGTLIEKPHSFSTACNIATQIVAQVASNQYGGQSISLAHLAPFVQISREKIRRAQHIVSMHQKAGQETVVHALPGRNAPECIEGPRQHRLGHAAVIRVRDRGDQPLHVRQRGVRVDGRRRHEQRRVIIVRRFGHTDAVDADLQRTAVFRDAAADLYDAAGIVRARADRAAVVPDLDLHAARAVADRTAEKRFAVVRRLERRRAQNIKALDIHAGEHIRNGFVEFHGSAFPPAERVVRSVYKYTLP